MSQMERIYFFHREVLKKRYPNTRTIRDEFGVSESSARRDIEYLREFLLAPIEFDRARNGYFYASSGFRLPFENVPEIIAMLGVLHKMAEEAGLSALPEVTALQERLSAILSPESKRLVNAIRFEKIEAEPVASERIKLILDAIQQGVAICFDYHKPNGEKSRRMVDPLRLLNYQWRWYLVAFCHLRNAMRIFHIPRMSAIELTGERCRVCEIINENLDSLLNKSFGIFKGNDVKTVKILFGGDAAAIVREQVWHPDQQLEDTQDGLVLTLRVTDFTEIIMKTLQFGSRAQVLEPEALRIEMTREIERMSHKYKLI
ncbi:helix-turn-helix transcriptional regulator [Dissulfurimicrobium hydrothermale]|uniref:helix-turn-helix transcriptional regulator n=1 Tax=Dissulfurimicrobium hydrothermale TaxID=1750598 RepID=UPI001EDADE4D|nr:WYL domain-containing protein [Dissulfurimicrobium hydrothermale]UKL14249.1 WYL domain-containing protein [Dissulfurimicrobium hydrothermale]